MLQVSRQVSYSLLLLALLAKEANPKNPASIKNIAKKTRLPYFFLSQLAARLKRAGILESKRGVKGGYYLRKSPKGLTIEKVIKAIGEDIKLTRCVSQRKCDFKKLCPLYPLWSEIEKELKAKMNKYTLEQFLF